MNVVITGEGRIDNQSINGKTPVGIVKLSKKYEKSVITIVGSSRLELDKIYESGINLVLEKAMRAYMLRR